MPLTPDADAMCSEPLTETGCNAAEAHNRRLLPLQNGRLQDDGQPAGFRLPICPAWIDPFAGYALSAAPGKPEHAQ